MIVPDFAVHCLSGGIDSVVLAYGLVSRQVKLHAVLFDYGQRHKQELTFAKLHCHKLGILFTTITLPQIPGSELTDGKGGVVVPNRNAILLSIAASLAVNAGAENVTFGCNAEDAKDFPDCRPEFIKAMNAALKASDTPVQIATPYIEMTKRMIVARGRELGVDLDSTWSCYRGGEKPCGKCLACIRRKEAMA